MRQLVCGCLMGLLCLCRVFAAAEPLLINQVSIDTQTFAAVDGATVNQFPAQQAALQQAMRAVLAGSYTFVVERFWVLKSSGAAIEMDVGNSLGRIPDSQRVMKQTLPDMSSITVWQRRHEYVALGLSPILPDGNTMYDLIELKKKKAIGPDRGR